MENAVECQCRGCDKKREHAALRRLKNDSNSNKASARMHQFVLGTSTAQASPERLASQRDDSQTSTLSPKRKRARRSPSKEASNVLTFMALMARETNNSRARHERLPSQSNDSRTREEFDFQAEFTHLVEHTRMCLGDARESLFEQSKKTKHYYDDWVTFEYALGVYNEYNRAPREEHQYPDGVLDVPPFLQQHWEVKEVKAAHFKNCCECNHKFDRIGEKYVRKTYDPINWDEYWSRKLCLGCMGRRLKQRVGKDINAVRSRLVELQNGSVDHI